MPDIIGAVGGFLGGLVGTAANIVWAPIKAVVDGLAAVADGVVSMLPNATDLHLSIPSGWLIGYSWVDSFLPVHEAITAAGMFVTIVTGLFVFRVAVLIYHLIPKPGIGT